MTLAPRQKPLKERGGGACIGAGAASVTLAFHWLVFGWPLDEWPWLCGLLVLASAICTARRGLGLWVFLVGRG